MTLNTLADLFGPVMLLSALVIGATCAGSLVTLLLMALWDEIGLVYRRWRRTWDARPGLVSHLKAEGNRNTGSGRASQVARIHWR